MRSKHILGIAVTALLATGVAGGVALASSHGEDGGVDAATLARAKVSLSQAIATAENHTGGKAVSADLDAKAGSPRIEVETMGPKGAETVVVDAQSGLVMAARAGEQAEQGEQGGDSDVD